MTEAYKNALAHGNENDASKKIHVIFESKPKGLSFTITDEGSGFDPESVQDPLDLNISSDTPAGRGLFLIRSLSDKVSITNEGSSIEMFFRISGIGHKAMKKRISHFNDYFQTIKQKV
jgi:serine/threonine-protein kinase RsbW